MRLTLKRHRDSRGTAAASIDVEVARLPSGMLELNYHVSGIISDLRIPPPKAVPNRTDELWRHTCFEAFIRAQQSAPYYELNFSPTTEWAAYRFSSHRNGMMIAREIGPPRIKVTSNSAAVELQASLELARLTDLPSDARWLLGLSAVIEETSGHMSYWALAHPPGKADFHHPDCFAHTLPAMGAP